MNELEKDLANLCASYFINNPEQIPALQKQLSKLSAESASRIRNAIFSQNGDLSTILSSENSNPGSDSWSVRTLKDAYAPMSPISYIVDGVFECPSLNIVYGHPGSLKSMVIADLCGAVVSGGNWLPPSADKILTNGDFKTVQGPVVWIDFDNGKRRTDERFRAIGKARKLSLDAPLYYYSMPSPCLDASDKDQMDQLAQRCLGFQAKLVVVDNLAAISGGRDENSSEMKHVMQHFRFLTEDLNLAVILIHHARKTNGSNSARMGDSLRGHSSIEGSIDLALYVKRHEDSSKILLVPTKVRGAELHQFAAEFTHTHKEGTKDLQEALFFGINPGEISMDCKIVANRNKINQGELIEAAVEIVLENKKINQSSLVEKVKVRYPDTGENKIRDAIKQAAASGRIDETAGPKNSKIYTIGALGELDDF